VLLAARVGSILWRTSWTMLRASMSDSFMINNPFGHSS
jgi:hypothetical protein